MATLATPEKVRELQRALYQRAKKEPNFRAYALYDKVYRDDVLAHAYALAKANGGAPGVDGVSFEDIETSGREALLQELKEELKTKRYRPGPVRRVEIPKLGGGTRPLGIPNIRDRVVQTAVKLMLEPLFEADFDRDSFGFRPKKDAHQAIEALREELGHGMHWIIDADISKYFDTIPHDRLMKAVAERVVDGAMLALVKMFLEAPIVDDKDGGRPRRNVKGTPQGGVISPLLANIYLNLLDRNFRRHAEDKKLHGRIVRYADDFVLLAPSRPDRELAWVQQLMERLGLHLHPEKTRVLDVTEEKFDFLGHEVRWTVRKTYLDISRKSLARMRDEVTASDEPTTTQPGNGHRRAEQVHQRRSELLPTCSGMHARQARLLRRSATRPMVGAQTRVAPSRMVARVEGPAPPRTGAVVRAPGPAAALKARYVNVEGSRMREIRTYGLMRGCWPDRLRTAGWGLLDHRGEGKGEGGGGCGGDGRLGCAKAWWRLFGWVVAGRESLGVKLVAVSWWTSPRVAAVLAFVRLGRPLFLGGGAILYGLGAAVARALGHRLRPAALSAGTGGGDVRSS